MFRRRKRSSVREGSVTLGVSVVPGSKNPFVVFPATMRPQHLGILGLSGSGKTHFIEHLIRQDIEQQIGFVVFDVHGDLAEHVTAFLAERGSFDSEVYARTVIIEPFDPDRSFGFNPLEPTPNTSPFLQAQEFAYILRRRWEEDHLGPRTQELLRNSLFTLSVSGETLLRLPKLLTQRRTRDKLVERLPDGEVKHFWTHRYNRLSANMQGVVREPLLTRISAFVSDPLIRDILGQKKSTFSFQEAMQKGLWVIVNLSQGRLGENSTILGSLLLTKLELEVMARAHVPEKERKLFAVYVDELQKLAGESFGRLIAEARKYQVSLVTGHQFWRQLEPYLQQAMLAVGSKAYFRLHYHDAADLAGELAVDEQPRYRRVLTLLERGEAVARIGARRPVLFTVPAVRPGKPTPEEIERLRAESARRYTTARSQIHQPEKPKSDNAAVERGNQALNTADLSDHASEKTN